MSFKNKEERGFTDRSYLFNLRFVVGLTIVALLMIISTAFTPRPMDLSPLGYIVPSAYGELGIHTGFVVWKAKTENMRKYPRVATQVQMSENQILQAEYYEGENQNG